MMKVAWLESIASGSSLRVIPSREPVETGNLRPGRRLRSRFPQSILVRHADKWLTS